MIVAVLYGMLAVDELEAGAVCHGSAVMVGVGC
jgi:hypothetical protein